MGKKVIMIKACLTETGLKIEKEEYDIIGANERLFVISDTNFTTINKGKRMEFGYNINVPKIEKNPLKLDKVIECKGYFLINEKEAIEKVKQEISAYLTLNIENLKNMKQKIIFE